MLQTCPKCGQLSYIKEPHGRIMKEQWGSSIHIADDHIMKCLNKDCKHESEVIRVYTEFGERVRKPWYKRIF